MSFTNTRKHPDSPRLTQIIKVPSSEHQLMARRPQKNSWIGFRISHHHQTFIHCSQTFGKIHW